MALNVFGLAVVRDAATVLDFFTEVIAGTAGTGTSYPTVNEEGGAVAITGGAYACDETDYTVDFAREDVESTAGALVSVLVKRQIEKLTITLIPFATGEATTAGVTGMAVLPAPMTVITLSASTLPVFNGTWNAVSGNKIKSKKAGVLVMTLNLERYDGAALAKVSS